MLHIGLLIDESGSMYHLGEEVVKNFNEFLAGQKKEGKGKVTMGFFSQSSPDVDDLRMKFTDKALSKVSKLTAEDYNPGGMTPLYDSIVQIVKKIKPKKADKVMVMILTDGLENASETKAEDVKELIKEKEKDGWEFTYFGANQDAKAASDAIELNEQGNVHLWQPTARGMAAAGGKMSSYATAAAAGWQTLHTVREATSYDLGEEDE